jgi:hypothetical protein
LQEVFEYGILTTRTRYTLLGPPGAFPSAIRSRPRGVRRGKQRTGSDMSFAEEGRPRLQPALQLTHSCSR